MNARDLARIAVLAVSAASISCGSVVREGSGTSFLIVEQLTAASGAEPDQFGGVLYSDVLTIVDDSPTIFSDLGKVAFALGLKDPGPRSSPTEPSQNQAITVNRYRVRYLRSDGRNTPGVDVPYGFDGSFTLTVSRRSEASFELVRHIAKMEAPLARLVEAPEIINTIAEITFYGRDQTGREVSAVANITVDFGNFGDPD